MVPYESFRWWEDEGERQRAPPKKTITVAHTSSQQTSLFLCFFYYVVFLGGADVCVLKFWIWMETRASGDMKMAIDDALNAFSPVSTPRIFWKSRRRSGIYYTIHTLLSLNFTYLYFLFLLYLLRSVPKHLAIVLSFSYVAFPCDIVQIWMSNSMFLHGINFQYCDMPSDNS